MDKFDQKNQHRATTAATVAVVAAVVVQIVVSCSNTGRARGAAWEPPERRIDYNFSGRVTLFCTHFLGNPQNNFVWACSTHSRAEDLHEFSLHFSRSPLFTSFRLPASPRAFSPRPFQGKRARACARGSATGGGQN